MKCSDRVVLDRGDQSKRTSSSDVVGGRGAGPQRHPYPVAVDREDLPETEHGEVGPARGTGRRQQDRETGLFGWVAGTEHVQQLGR